MTSFLHFRRAAAGFFLACAVGASASAADATSSFCGARGTAYRLVTAKDGVYALRVGKDDLVTWRVLSGGGAALIDIGGGFQRSIDNGKFAAHQGLDTFKIKTRDVHGQIAVSCARQGAGVAERGSDLAIATDSQVGATARGLGLNAQARFGMKSEIAMRNRVFMSTSNLAGPRFLPPDWNGWATLESRSYSGGLDGRALNLVGGVDRLIGDSLLLGALAGLDNSRISDRGTLTSSVSPMLGGYVAARFGRRIFMEGFFAYAAPRYQTQGARFAAVRHAGGISLRGRFKRGGAVIDPFISARQYTERQPSYITSTGIVIAANRTRASRASLGVKVLFSRQKNLSSLSPYVSASADYRRSDSTLTGLDSLVAPRLGFGLSGVLGGGQFSLDVDIGKPRADSFERGIKLGYAIKF